MSGVGESEYYLNSVRWINKNLQKVAHFDKSVLFGAFGGIAALICSLIGQWINPFDYQSAFLYTGVWVAYIGFGIGVAIAIVQNWYMQRLEVAGRAIGRVAMISIAGGFLAGVCLILTKKIFLFLGPLAHIAGWTIEGLIIAFFVARAIPNLTRKNALIAGAVAGFLGGLLVLLMLSGPLGAAIGDSFKGILIGLAIALVEKVGRTSWIVVHRDLSNQQSTGIVLMDKPPEILLGENPVQIGSSRECEIYVAPRDGEPPVLASFGLQDGRIVYHNYLNRKQCDLHDGEKIAIANLTIEAFSKKSDTVPEKDGPAPKPHDRSEI